MEKSSGLKTLTGTRLAALLLLALLPWPALGAGVVESLSSDTASYVLERFIRLLTQHGERLRQAATTLFIALTTITVVLKGISLALSHGDMTSFASVMVGFLLTTGFFFYLLNHGADFGTAVINSLLEVADTENTGPAELFTLVCRLGSRYATMVEQIKAGFLGSLMLGIPCLYFFFLMCNVCVGYCVLFLCSYSLCIGGVIVLGLGALSYTRYIAVNYLRAVTACGLQLMITVMVCNAGFKILQELFNELETSTRTIVIEDCMVVIFVAMFVRGAVDYLPSALGSLMYGQGGMTPQLTGGLIPGGGAVRLGVSVVRHEIPKVLSALNRRHAGI